MRTADDVRRDPKVGDVARVGRYERRVVGRPVLLQPWVTYTVDGLGGLRSETVAHWGKVLASAEVLHVAD